ncbi:hypothetical protein HanRHA438_Chr09g0373641 [Helianthus annuus]|uniref:Uncharacterized protein n=1 Tax=Helianthus annuus TaxID=4232 RepID=A0A9K3I260_HELAN|nr:hypothetical protein HanXRQr2_Chr09g0362181 [Helianthus annuus]KAJ0531914.1 hypothetical protein HanIR_Chr09g0390881 [Helianthus annuus]KAJ0885936.1 hypothetical protein HanRHA438_Chr09g0373641 [Helianthus annuus]KAJ0891086.1 hypothetical protein HanPSC8_Chr09g0349471 [Helianthus annuus]
MDFFSLVYHLIEMSHVKYRVIGFYHPNYWLLVTATLNYHFAPATLNLTLSVFCHHVVN